jgi:hypothetical protein
METLFKYSGRKKEFAPGIPLPTTIHKIRTVTQPEVWEFVIQEHQAKRAGKHYDIRLGDPKTGHGHSWAVRYLPTRGQPRLANQTFTHDIDYFNFEGEIGPGYGEGTVKIIERDNAEIIYADDNEIRFNVYRGNTVREYLLKRTSGNQWLFMDVTDDRSSLPDVPDDRPKFKEIPIEDAKKYINEPNYLFSRKDDGVQVVYYFKPNGKLKIFSPRASVLSETGLIDHTYKIPHLFNIHVPELKGTVARGELFLVSKKTGRFIPINEIIKYTNSNTWTARAVLNQLGAIPRTTIFDIEKYKGKDVSKLPYAEKLKLMFEIASKVPGIEIPEYAVTPEEKIDLMERIRTGKVPETIEGIVIQNIANWQKPLKAKFKKEVDVYVREILPAKGSMKGIAAGGFAYSLTPDGPIVGAVGTGFTLEEKIDMWKHPEKYIGRVARIRTIEQLPSGAYRQPSFISWHVEKGKEFAV